jgi:hypothetical protein
LRLNTVNTYYNVTALASLGICCNEISVIPRAGGKLL